MTRQLSVDHYIQASAVKRLFLESPLTFSELKPDDIENSLFMYHIRKLIGRGIIEKSSAGFELTPAGFQWANEMNKNSALQPHRSPRFLVQVIVIQDGQILLSRRGEPAAMHIQQYLLPGKIIKFGQTSQDRAEAMAKEMGVTLMSGRIGHAEILDFTHDHHAVIDYYLAEVESDYRRTFDDLYVTAFHSLEHLEDYGPQVSEPVKSYLKDGRGFSVTVKIEP